MSEEHSYTYTIKTQPEELFKVLKSKITALGKFELKGNSSAGGFKIMQVILKLCNVVLYSGLFLVPINIANAETMDPTESTREAIFSVYDEFRELYSVEVSGHL
jgi:hypothetical protein